MQKFSRATGRRARGLFRKFSRFGGRWSRGFGEFPFDEHTIFGDGVDVGSADGNGCNGVR